MASGSSQLSTATEDEFWKVFGSALSRSDAAARYNLNEEKDAQLITDICDASQKESLANGILVELYRKTEAAKTEAQKYRAKYRIKREQVDQITSLDATPSRNLRKLKKDLSRYRAVTAVALEAEGESEYYKDQYKCEQATNSSLCMRLESEREQRVKLREIIDQLLKVHDGLREDYQKLSLEKENLELSHQQEINTLLMPPNSTPMNLLDDSTKVKHAWFDKLPWTGERAIRLLLEILVARSIGGFHENLAFTLCSDTRIGLGLLRLLVRGFNLLFGWLGLSG